MCAIRGSVGVGLELASIAADSFRVLVDAHEKHLTASPVVATVALVATLL